jgi:hypothetical protein
MMLYRFVLPVATATVDAESVGRVVDRELSVAPIRRNDRLSVAPIRRNDPTAPTPTVLPPR